MIRIIHKCKKQKISLLVGAALPLLNQCRYFSEQEGNAHAHIDLISHLGFGLHYTKFGDQTKKGTSEKLPDT